MPGTAAGRSGTFLARLTATLHVWHRRARDRSELTRLTTRDARDLGLDPGVISYEANKPFWRA
ncbi:MAG: hypothetical protein KIT36_13935 [Alphaproteobacteria bacterium]|nr:hypothetical protein [Alphaproteobacteria bacterium]